MTPLALHFGPESRRLFGVWHRPAGASRRTGVLLLPSLGMELQRTYRGLRLLAQTLTHSGFHCLRFDYSGTGDSSGDGRAMRLADWIEDTRLAADTLREQAGVQQLALLGLRFGALLAQQVVAGGQIVAAGVALWDSPPSGAVFVENLQHLDDVLNELRGQQRRRHHALPPPARDELLGHDWPEALAKDIATLPGLREDLPGRVIFVSRDRTPPESVESIRLPDVGHWSDIDRLDAPWLPTASFRIVAERLAHGLP